MLRLNKVHPALRAGWTGLAFMFLIAFAFASGVEADPHDADRLLKQADYIKTSNNVEFKQILSRLDNDATQLSPNQQFFLRYLKAWQLSYNGDYGTAISQLDAIIAESTDITIRFRANVTIVNVLAVSAQYQEGYERLNQLVEMLPKVSDRDARIQGLQVITILYTLAGQYDLATNFANRLQQEHATPKEKCAGQYLKLQALFYSGTVRTAGKDFQDGIDICAAVNESLYADLIRTYVANIELNQGHPADAIKLLQDNYADTQATHYPPLISIFDSLLAEAYFQTRDLTLALQYAQRAVDGSPKGQVTKPLVDAYRVLYEIARQQGDYRLALEYHERYTTADKGYLTDESAKALAYQMVHQQVQEKKLEIDSLSKQNQVLHLQQTVNSKTAEARDLYIVMLLMLLGSIAFWAWRTKRSEVKFMHLARRDGLTGIFNRQHFIDASGHALEYCSNSLRDACVVVIDLDHFKEVNDAHGHAAGDLVLRRAVTACQKHLRSMDVFGRLGGEEFGILMPDCVPERAADVAEEIRLAIAALSESADHGIGFPIYASFGVSAAHWSGYDLSRLLAHADSALYKAKREGRNRVAVYGKSTERELRDRRHH